MQFSPGDIVSIFTPDDTHYAIALAAIERGMHVILTKPPVKTVVEHLSLVKRAREKNVIVVVEVCQPDHVLSPASLTVT